MGDCQSIMKGILGFPLMPCQGFSKLQACHDEVQMCPSPYCGHTNYPYYYPQHDRSSPQKMNKAAQLATMTVIKLAKCVEYQLNQPVLNNIISEKRI